MAKQTDPLYQPHPSKVAQIAECAEHDARLREMEKAAKDAAPDADGEPATTAKSSGAKTTPAK